MLTHPGWVEVDGLRHGFLERDECAAFSGGRWEPVVERAGARLPVCTVHQVHGVRVVTAEPEREPPEADGLATATRGLAVGVVTADCVPVLLIARARRVAAAVHAGWRGTAAGVLEGAVAHLRNAFGVQPVDVEVALGPAVGPCCYRVGPEVRAAFETRTGMRTAPAWAPSGDRLVLDLRAAAYLLLTAAGVRATVALGPCTMCTPSYASYRRDGAGAGRQLSFIGWV